MTSGAAGTLPGASAVLASSAKQAFSLICPFYLIRITPGACNGGIGAAYQLIKHMAAFRTAVFQEWHV